MSETLIDGTNSGRVPDSVKRQVFVSGLGICAEPTCNERVVQDRTTLGECAHIIPRIVGSHPREDYTTPLNDRKKEENLLYLCEKHHKIVDNKQHAHIYTAEFLREWKRRHEDWAAGVTKNSPYLPQGLKDVLANWGTQIAEQINVSEAIIGTLLDTCQELLDRHLINEAKIFLSQIDVLLLTVNNASLNARADLLNAILLIRNEQIPEAKRQLLQIIQNNPHEIETMLEYLELCEDTPEPDDGAEQVERLARDLADDHPRLLLIDLVRKVKKLEVVDTEDIFGNWADDTRLNARFISQHALICDLTHKIAQRDDLINRWEKELPNSPRPHLFRAHFRVLDYFRSPVTSPEEQARLDPEVLRFCREEEDKAKAKDPRHLRDQISWLLIEIRLALADVKFSIDANYGNQLRNSLVSLVEQCYFDSFINSILLEVLPNLRIVPDQWKRITRKIQESKMPPAKPLVELLFLQALHYDELLADLNEFIVKYDYSNLPEILQAIRDGDAAETARRVNVKNDSGFTLLLLHSIAHHEIAIPLTVLLKVNDDYREDLLYARFMILDLHKRDNEALDLIPSFQIHKAAPHALYTIGRIAYRNKRWHLFIPPALQLLNFDIPQSDKSLLHAELAMAYFEQGDDSSAINHADQALSHQELGEENSQTILHILGQSLLRKGLPDEACAKFKQYKHIKRSFPLLLQEAELYLKSSLADKYKVALSLVMRAFEQIDSYNDELYISALLLLIELGNVGIIPIEDEPSVEDSFFIKLDGFPTGWFYIGEMEKSLGAEYIRPGTANYDAVIHKAISDEIEWPADRFTGCAKRRILNIATAPAFLSHRAHEAMQYIAAIGNAPIYSIHLAKEDGSFNIESLKQFLEQVQPDNEFFSSYISAPLPFSFLCTMSGGLPQALGKIASERKGFIRCNNNDMDAQEAAANEVLQGANCFIDGLSAFMLTEAELLETVIQFVPNLGVSTSVIRLLRKIAGGFDISPSHEGWGGVIDGNFRFTPRNIDRDEAIRKHLLLSADLLDSLPNKVIGKQYPKLEGDKNLDHVTPDYFVDTFRFSQEKEAHILIDDALLLQAYKLMGESPIPQYFSSFSLIRMMVENKLIAWDAYLGYFQLLSLYRYHFLPISADDMVQTVFPPVPGGLVVFAPQNISLLNLQLTLSLEYGVDDKTVAGVLSSFFTKLIQDDTVPPEIADEIFALTLVQGLPNRERRPMANILLQICRQNTLNRNWVSPKSKIKLEILNKQLFGFAHGLDPLVIESPLLLRVMDSKDIGRPNN